MENPQNTAEMRFALVGESFLTDPDVTHPTAEPQATKRFGATALEVNGRIFAMLVGDRLVVKLPRQRVDALITAGERERFDPGHGRLMNEWLAVESTLDERWIALANEARAFVAARR